VVLAADGCVFRYQRPQRGVLVIAIEGHDKGQFGTATLDEISLALRRERPLELFIDARASIGAATQVSEDWTRYFAINRADFTRVHVLAASKAVQLTVSIAQHLSRTGNLIQLYSDPSAFQARLASLRDH
jgi:hypothetical protein